MTKSTPDAATVAAYRQQLLEAYRLATPHTTANDEANWLDSRYPEPNIERDKAAIDDTLAITAPATESTPSPSFVGYLRVYVYTAGGAEPILGAQVTVLRSDNNSQTILSLTTTDRDGFTPLIALPSVDPALTLQPGNSAPFTAYTIRVAAADFRSVEHRNVPVYGNNYVTQPVALLPAQTTQETDQLFFSGGPIRL